MGNQAHAQVTVAGWEEQTWDGQPARQVVVLRHALTGQQQGMVWQAARLAATSPIPRYVLQCQRLTGLALNRHRHPLPAAALYHRGKADYVSA